MYSVTSGLAVLYIVGGPLVSLLLVVVAIPIIIYSLFTRNARRRLIANRITLGLSIAAVLLSLELWYELITGRFINGKPLNYNDPDFAFYKFVGVLEALTLFGLIVSLIRQRMGRAS